MFVFDVFRGRLRLGRNNGTDALQLFGDAVGHNRGHFGLGNFDLGGFRCDPAIFLVVLFGDQIVDARLRNRCFFGIQNVIGAESHHVHVICVERDIRQVDGHAVIFRRGVFFTFRDRFEIGEVHFGGIDLGFVVDSCVG